MTLHPSSCQALIEILSTTVQIHSLDDLQPGVILPDKEDFKAASYVLFVSQQIRSATLTNKRTLTPYYIARNYSGATQNR